MAVAIAIVLAVFGLALLWAGRRVWLALMDTAAEAARPPERENAPHPALTHPPQADALVYLFAQRFVRPPKPGKAINPRMQAWDPLTGEELDPCEWAAKMLFVLCAEQFTEGTVELRLVERTPTLMPPFPHKNWEMQMRRLRSLLSSPLGDCLAVAFDMVAKKSRAGAGSEAEAPEGDWVPVELLVEKMLQVVRTETSFWQREGVYGDLRNYVADALVAEGFLEEKSGDTWIERFRRRKLEADREAIRPWAREAEALLERISAFRRQHGSAEYLTGEERAVSITHLNTPASLTRVEGDVTQLMWADALGITVYETLVALRQLEPTGDGSI